MRPRHALLVLAVTLAAGSVWATAPGMSLDQDGRLLQLAPGEDRLELSRTSADGQTEIIPIPGTTGSTSSQHLLEIDSSTGAVILAWQEHIDDALSQVRMASYVEGTWFGPFIVAGGDGVGARNPALLVTSAETALDDGTTVETTFAHLAWWEDSPVVDGGIAMLGEVLIDDAGRPLLNESLAYELRTLIPWGVSCDAAEQPEPLAHPKLFVDPGTGDAHILFVDLTDCLFEIVQLHPTLEAEDDQDDEATEQRRRHVIEFGVRKDIVIAPDLQLGGTSFEIGHDLAVVGHWDVDGSIEYIRMDDSGWSNVRTLDLQNISHEDGVRLIRKLVR